MYLHALTALYDRLADGKELKDVSEEQPQIVSRLRAELDAIALPANDKPRDAPTVLTQGLAQQVGFGRRTGFVAASLSSTDILAYRAGQDPLSEFVWMDRSGRRLDRLGEYLAGQS